MNVADLRDMIFWIEKVPADHRANCKRIDPEAPLERHGERCAVNVRDQIIQRLASTCVCPVGYSWRNSVGAHVMGCPALPQNRLR